MPRAARSPEEVERVREAIIKHAVDLIARHGFEGFSMRGLAQYIHFTERSIGPYESISLGGMKNYESRSNDFPLDFKGHVLGQPAYCTNSPGV